MENYITARNNRRACWQTLVDSYQSAADILKNQWDILEKSHKDLQTQKDALAQENGGASVSDNDIIDINSGGTIVRVVRGTLTQIKGTTLEAIFSGRWEKQLSRDSKGRIFLDVNPVCFKAVVDFLNEYKISPVDNRPDLPTVDSENQQYLDCLLVAFGLGSRGLSMDSNIVSAQSHFSALEEFLREDGIPTTMALLYRGTRDGMNATSFHERCDDKGSTITVVRDDQGYIFGGYTDKSWSMSNKWVQSEAAFLFGLHCHETHDPTKMKLKTDRKMAATYCNPQYGPTFGGGHDFAIFGEGSHSEVGDTYILPPGKTQYFLTGDCDFTLCEVEVFQITRGLSQSPIRTPPVQDNQQHCLTAFPDDVKKIFEEEEKALAVAKDKLSDLQQAFEQEQVAIKIFCVRDESKIVSLNVSGGKMAVSQSTLGHFPDSVLYKQFADPRWLEVSGGCSSRSSASPSEWDSTEVVAWAKSLKHLSSDVSSQLGSITGGELLALEREDIRDLGIQNPGTVALLVQKIQQLRDDDEEKAAPLIEHSEYCFGKIIDHMRMKAMGGLEVPVHAKPKIRESEKKRFKCIVDYYFPNESASQFISDDPN